MVGGVPATGACIRVDPLGERVPLLPAPLVKSLRLFRREAEGLIDRLSRTGCQGIAWPQRTVARAEGVIWLATTFRWVAGVWRA